MQNIIIFGIGALVCSLFLSNFIKLSSILKGEDFNFKEYKVVCSYYSDKKLMKNMNDTYIELRADKKSVWDKLFESILRLIKRMT